MFGARLAADAILRERVLIAILAAIAVATLIVTADVQAPPAGGDTHELRAAYLSDDVMNEIPLAAPRARAWNGSSSVQPRDEVNG